MNKGKAELVRSRISSDTCELDILNMIYPWIPNSSQIRPLPEQLVEKHAGMNAVNETWKSMRDYILHQIFDKPVLEDLDGKLGAADADVTATSIVFCVSQFPYNVQHGGKHWILWFGCHEEPNININNVILKKLQDYLGHDDFDYAWYQNPKMSLPDFYHVHVFWVQGLSTI